MLLTTERKLKSQIVEALATTPNLSAEDIFSRTHTGVRSFSMRAIYKELKALETLGVIMNTKGRYALQLPWLINMTALLHDAYQRHVDAARREGAPLLTDPVRLVFNDLARLDHAWIQYMIALQRAYPRDGFRVWKPEQWFHLVHEQVTGSFFSALNRIGAKQWHMIGHDCFVCRRGAAEIPKRNAHVLFVEDPFGFGISTYLTSIGDHLITVRLNRGFAEKMHELFVSIQNEEEMRSAHVRSIMTGPVRATITIEYKPKLLEGFRRRFDQLFEEAELSTGRRICK